jgi:hypothetical protein
VKVGSSVKLVHDLYTEPFRLGTETLPGGKTAEIRRHPTLGIGFEFQGSQVTSIALYPPEKEAEGGQ